MNILMVMPKSFHGEFFPIGMAYISSLLKYKGYDVFCLNLNSYDKPDYEILEQHIRKYDIKIVCTGGISLFYAKLKDLVKIIKNIDKNIITIMGGGVVSSDPELILNNLKMDFGIIGEGEYTVAELVDAVINKRDFNQIKGIIYKDERGMIICTQPRPEIKDLDSLPYPDYAGFNVERYIEQSLPDTIFYRAVGHDKPRILDMTSSRSCPFSCTFCFHTSGKTYRQRTLESFFKEVDYVIGKYGVNVLSVCDELFSVDSDRMLKFGEMAKKYKVKWRVSIKVNPPVDLNVLRQLKEYGLIHIIFGLESVNNKILKSMRKGITGEQINVALKTVYDAKICFGGNFLVGDTEETVETATDTIKWWAKHPRLNTNLSIGDRVITFPGTSLYHHAVSTGLIKDRIKFIEEGCPVINVAKNMNEKDYLYLKWMLYKIKKNPEYISVGKVLYTKKLGNINGKNIYYLKIKCPHCKTVSEYNDCWQDTSDRSIFFTVTCKNKDCCQSFKVSGRKAFYKNYGAIIKLEFYNLFKTVFATLYMTKYEFLNRKKNSSYVCHKQI